VHHRVLNQKLGPFSCPTSFLFTSPDEFFLHLPSPILHFHKFLNSQRAFNEITKMDLSFSLSKMTHVIEVDSVKRTIIKWCEVFLLPNSLPPTTLPLTFFDIPWFFPTPLTTSSKHHFPFSNTLFPSLSKTSSPLPPILSFPHNSISLTFVTFFATLSPLRLQISLFQKKRKPDEVSSFLHFKIKYKLDGTPSGLLFQKKM